MAKNNLTNDSHKDNKFDLYKLQLLSEDWSDSILSSSKIDWYDTINLSSVHALASDNSIKDKRFLRLGGGTRNLSSSSDTNSSLDQNSSSLLSKSSLKYELKLDLGFLSSPKLDSGFLSMELKSKPNSLTNYLYFDKEEAKNEFCVCEVGDTTFLASNLNPDHTDDRFLS